MRVLGRVVLERFVHLRGQRLRDERPRVERAFQDSAPVGVNDLALLVHHVVVLEDVLADLVVVVFDLALGALDGLADQARLDGLLVGEAHAVHDRGHTVAAEQAHHFVFQRNVEARRPRIALTAGAAAQLIVDAPRFVSFGADDVQAAVLGHAFAQLDVGAAAGHVGGDRHLRVLAGVFDDFGLLLVVLRVEHVALDALAAQHRSEQFALLDRTRADENRPALVVLFDDFGDDGLEFGLLRLKDDVRRVAAPHRHVGRNHDDVESVDVAELALLGLRRTGHAG